jgi:hypothetical protein
MKFMTLQQYGHLLFQVLFKGRSLLETTKFWSGEHIVKQVIQVSIMAHLSRTYLVQGKQRIGKRSVDRDCKGETKSPRHKQRAAFTRAQRDFAAGRRELRFLCSGFSRVACEK